jgi:GntR family transcriptional regulator, transcriptional repressor for pyruvate dehydrogenase complex
VSLFPAFSPIVRDRPLAERISDQLLDAISMNELTPGEALPSTQALAAQFGVSRTVIREAVRTLIVKDVVRVEGRRLFVASVRPSVVRDSMTLFIKSRGGIDYGRIHEVRLPLEIAIAGLAADRATPPDVVRLRQVCDELPAAIAAGSVEAAAYADAAFHRTLAELTQNDLFPLLLDAMGEVMHDVRVETLVLPARQVSTPAEHLRILEAVVAGDPAAARAAMREHLDDSKAMWQRVEPQKADEKGGKREA